MTRVKLLVGFVRELAVSRTRWSVETSRSPRDLTFVERAIDKSRRSVQGSRALQFFERAVSQMPASPTGPPQPDLAAIAGPASRSVAVRGRVELFSQTGQIAMARFSSLVVIRDAKRPGIDAGSQNPASSVHVIFPASGTVGRRWHFHNAASMQRRFRHDA